jgi:hypothetical protein
LSTLGYATQIGLDQQEPGDPKGSAEAYWKEPKSCLGRVFNYKLVCFVDKHVLKCVSASPYLELKTRLRFCPPSLCLCMVLIVLGCFAQGSQAKVTMSLSGTFSKTICQLKELLGKSACLLPLIICLLPFIIGIGGFIIEHTHA